MKKLSLTFAIILTSLAGSYAQPNYDESKVPAYKLPELLISKNGKKIKNAKQWMNIRRPEVLALFEEHMYGKIPGELKISSSKVIEEGSNGLGGKALRKQVLLSFEKNGRKLEMNMLIFLPKGIQKAPLFIGYNFGGNHTVADDPEIFIPGVWMRNNASLGIRDNRAREKDRGISKSAWQAERIIDAGYGLATIYYGDVDPDKDHEDFSDGVHPLLFKADQIKPAPDEWGSITAWAWGLIRALDYLETEKNVDAGRIIVMGHSRLGKTALWAGALDQRFAIVISNNSGCGGAALSRRLYGETLKAMNNVFPHWLCDNCLKYDDNVNAMPVDQHMLIALIAPRPVYIASAEDDQWADPKGEYLSGYHAGKVYKLFKKTGLPSSQMPAINQPVMNTIGYHIRSGEHAVTAFDWDQYIRFADMHLKK